MQRLRSLPRIGVNHWVIGEEVAGQPVDQRGAAEALLDQERIVVEGRLELQ